MCFSQIKVITFLNQQNGWWGLIAGPGISLCRPCNCDAVGAINSSCDLATGQCTCKPGVGGNTCDTCMELFYGFSVYGCSGNRLSISFYIN